MKKTIGLIANQFFYIATGMLFCIGLMALIFNDHNPWPWYFPFEIIGVAILTALASLVYYSKNELSKNALIVRRIIHFFLVLGMVFVAGYLFKWWSDFSGLLIVGLIFLMVYVSVSVATYLSQKNESNKINEALKKLPKDEE